MRVGNMGEFPIVRAKGTLPGVSGRVRGSLDFDTGGAEVGQAVAGLGEGLFDIGMKYWIRDATSQLADSKLVIERIVEETAQGLKSNPDHTTYPQTQKDMISRIDAVKPKNPIAAQQLELIKKANTVIWEKMFAGAAQERIDASQEATLINLQQEAIQTGKPSTFRKYVFQYAKTNPDQMPADRVTKILKDTAQDVELAAMKRLARDNPTAVLDMIKDVDYEKTSLTVEDIQAVENMAYSVLSRQSSERDALQEQTGNQLLADFWNGKLVDPQVVTDYLEKGLITTTMAMYIRQAILNPVEIDNVQARGEVLGAITALKMGIKTKKEVLDTYYKNLSKLTPVTQKTLQFDIYEEVAAADARGTHNAIRQIGMTLGGEYDIETRLYTRFTNDQTADAYGWAILELTDLVKQKAADNKPMDEREKLVEAMRIGNEAKRRVQEKEFTKKGEKKSPYPDYPDAFLEDGVWKVRQGNIVYRIED